MTRLTGSAPPRIMTVQHTTTTTAATTTLRGSTSRTAAARSRSSTATSMTASAGSSIRASRRAAAHSCSSRSTCTTTQTGSHRSRGSSAATRSGRAIPTPARIVTANRSMARSAPSRPRFRTSLRSRLSTSTMTSASLRKRRSRCPTRTGRRPRSMTAPIPMRSSRRMTAATGWARVWRARAIRSAQAPRLHVYLRRSRQHLQDRHCGHERAQGGRVEGVWLRRAGPAGV